jgi:ABC-2 type transport system ATP-binding protein
MRSIFGLVALDGGAMSWDDQTITPTLRNTFGYMPEQRGLYPKMKAGEQVAWLGQLRGMGAAEAREAARRWLTLLGLEDRIDDRIEHLSHGNQQRAQLAASLVHDPELLVLDEPFSGLDPMGADAMAQILRDRAANGAAVVFSSHQLDVVEDLCEDVAVIANGRIVLDGTMADVRASAPRRRLEVAFADPTIEWTPPTDALPARDGRGVAAWLVPAQTDIAALLTAANRLGQVTHFAFTPPALSEIFREAVK